MENKNHESAYINKLEEKVVNLSLQLKSKTNELNYTNESHRKSIGKLIHNLKNPIGVIFSFSEILLEDIDNYSSEKIEKYLEIIKNSANFSIETLNSVAKYIQHQAPDFKYTFKSLNYNQLVLTIIDEFNAELSKKNIKIEKNIPETPIILNLDAKEISLGLRNIIHNAIRYSTNNSTLKITLKESKSTVETTIIDEGIGILKQDLQAIFKEFFVVNTYSEDKQKCIGLGLPIAKKIIKDHNGDIFVTSTFNKGTSFKVILPKK
ncbi:sensor histidine kinase [Lutibacter sp.]